MTLIKSLLLGSAAGLVAVSAAQAADLPTRKGPVAAEYVRVCSITVAGAPVVGFVLPGSDTCFKISGYISGQIEGGNLYASNNVNYTRAHTVADPITGLVGAPTTIVHHESEQDIGGDFNRDSFGYTTRFNLTFDAVSNTAYGPLVAHGEYQFNNGAGYDASQGASDGGLNRAYVTWAGLTAGKIDSFFSFTGGGLAWNNFFSPDRKGFNQPDLLAYTASFGGGFSATLSVESTNGADAFALNANNTATSGGSETGYLGSATQGGLRVPDIVGSLDVKQAWGAAHVAGVAHDVRATSITGDGATIDKWGYAVDAGVSFNIPNLAGSVIGLTGAWSQNATLYSGLVDGMAGEFGQQVNGNGQGMAIADAFYNGNGEGTWATPTAWSIAGWAQFVLNPQVTVGLEGSYAELHWSGQDATSLLSDSRAFIVGGVAHYDPVKNLDFEFELLYENVQTAQPTGYITHVVGGGSCAIAANACTTSWHGQSDGFQARMQITRNF